MHTADEEARDEGLATPVEADGDPEDGHAQAGDAIEGADGEVDAEEEEHER